MTIQIRIPPTYEPERRYVIGVLFDDFLGLETEVTVDGSFGGVRVEVGDDRVLEIVDGLFATTAEDWLTLRSLPTLPLPTYDARLDQDPSGVGRLGLPIIFGDPRDGAPAVERRANGLRLHVDVLGSAFFMLTRYEEAVVDDRDVHGRFPAAASLAVRAGFLHRPIIDEYVELLWSSLRRLWPRLRRRERTFSVFSTHDVDNPFLYADTRLRHLTRTLARDIVRSSVGDAMASARSWFEVRRVGFERDPFYTFGRIMDLTEAAGVPAAFFFIPDPMPIRRSAFPYRLEDPAVEGLLKEIHGRGHEIGIHPSYVAHNDLPQLRKEVGRLRYAFGRLSVGSEEIGGRHHYLRWSTSSFAAWDAAGLAYDSTLCYAERPGFRAGVCRSYQTYDLVQRRPLRLRERPLIIMDQGISARQYLNFPPDGQEAAALVSSLKDRCRSVAGEFVVLWHNSSLARSAEFDLYRAAISD